MVTLHTYRLLSTCYYVELYFDMIFVKKNVDFFYALYKDHRNHATVDTVTVLTREEREQGKERHFFVQSLVLESALDSMGGHLILTENGVT